MLLDPENDLDEVHAYMAKITENSTGPGHSLGWHASRTRGVLPCVPLCGTLNSSDFKVKFYAGNFPGISWRIGLIHPGTQ